MSAAPVSPERKTQKLDVVLPRGGSLEAVRAMPVLAPFSNEALAFLGDLSATLLRSPDARRHPELVALGYWMRPAVINALVERQRPAPTIVPSARGVVFHIAPANVDTIFVYSWMVSLLAGNSNVLRLSRRSNPQLDVLLDKLRDLFDDPKHAPIRDRVLLIRYAPDPDATRSLSDACDVRVVWGGDATVAEIRQVPLPPLATEVVFGDRFSVALVHAAAWVEADEKTRAAAIRAFANDAYWFMQMACSSPRMVVWVGDDAVVQQARDSFWTALRSELPRLGVDFSAADYLNKRASAFATSAAMPDVHVEPETDADIVRLWIDEPDLDERWRHCGAGLFWETSRASLEDVVPLIERSIQTVAHFGFSREQILDIARRHPRGGDRWVPFGRALDFDYVWDGHDLIAVFTRKVVVQA